MYFVVVKWYDFNSVVCFGRQYTTIKDLAQRRQYKADFNADYAEYRNLHGIVEKVSRRFAELKERLKQEDQSSPTYKVKISLVIMTLILNKNLLFYRTSRSR